MQVFVRDKNVHQALRVLNKKMQREGIFREMKLRGHYEKPSEKKTAREGGSYPPCPQARAQENAARRSAADEAPGGPRSPEKGRPRARPPPTDRGKAHSTAAACTWRIRKSSQIRSGAGSLVRCRHRPTVRVSVTPSANVPPEPYRVHFRLVMGENGRHGYVSCGASTTTLGGKRCGLFVVQPAPAPVTLCSSRIDTLGDTAYSQVLV